MRKASKKYDDLKEKTIDSIAPVKVLLADVFQRLELKGKRVECFASATLSEIESMWSALHSVDDTVSDDEKWVKSNLDKHPKLKAFMDHCCHKRHYCFSIKKCGQPSCEICKPPHLPLDVFDELKHLPDPTPGNDGHYKSFQEVYGTVTSEDSRPSLQKCSVRAKSLPFVASVQHARNTNIMVQCEECEMWRIVYSKFQVNNC